MKPHIKLTLTEDIAPDRIPYWEDVAAGKAKAQARIAPAVDQVLEKYDRPVRVTREYQAAGKRWDKDEVTSGFNRVYRLILKQNTDIPAGLIKEISVLPLVETVTPGEVATADLPHVTARSFSIETDQRSRDAIHLPEAHES